MRSHFVETCNHSHQIKVSTRLKMLTKRAKYLYGIEINLSSLVCGVPFYWNFNEEKLYLIKQNGFAYWKWIVGMMILWIHEFILTFKLLACKPLKCLDTSWVRIFLHLYWVGCLMFPTWLNISHVLYKESLVAFVNKTFELDQYLTS